MSRPSTSNDEHLEALALATDIDPEMLKAAQIKMVTDDVADLKANAGKIVTYLESFEAYARDGSGKQVAVCDEDEISIESMFDRLPAHVQYKLMHAAVRAHDKAQQKSLMSLLRGKLDAAGDIKFIKANREDIVAWLGTFMKAKGPALEAYMERGGMLPMLEDRTIVSGATHVGDTHTKPSSTVVDNLLQPTKPVMQSAAARRMQEATDAAQARRDEDKAEAEKKTKGQMRRAPAPAKQ